jgi:hypothetical protein
VTLPKGCRLSVQTDPMVCENTLCEIALLNPGDPSCTSVVHASVERMESVEEFEAELDAILDQLKSEDDELAEVSATRP